MKIKALNDRVIVKRTELPDDMVNGLYRPDIAKDKPQEGLVISTGNGKVIGNALVPLDVEVGDKILFGKYAGTEVKVGEENLLILREDEIFAKLE